MQQCFQRRNVELCLKDIVNNASFKPKAWK